MDRHFKLIIKSLQQIVDSLVHAIKRQSRDNDAASKSERKEEEEGEKASETFERSVTPRKLDDRSHDCVQPITSTPRIKIVPTIESLDNIFETTEDSLATKVQNVGCKCRKVERRCKPTWVRWVKSTSRLS